MKALLSIKPQFVEKIFSGEKKFEYRKVVFAQKNVKTIVVYATMPIGKIVGEFSIDEILEYSPTELWEVTQKFSGVEKKFYDEYFEGRKKAFAIKIKKVTLYDTPINPYDSEEKFTPPQSFSYIKPKKLSISGCLVIDTEGITRESKKFKKTKVSKAKITEGVSKPTKLDSRVRF
jgi:predicted transcriptional regulator